MAHHTLDMPIDERQVRALRVGDTVTLERTLFGIRDATQIHMFDRGRRTRFDLNGHAVIHTAPNVRRVERSNEHPAGYAAVCIGTTTSQRMERFTKPAHGARGRAHRHRQGRPRRRLPGRLPRPRRRLSRHRRRRRGARDDLDHRDRGGRPRGPRPGELWRFAVKGFGPILVAMDAHGGSLYDKVRETAESRRAAALAAMGVSQ